MVISDQNCEGASFRLISDSNYFSFSSFLPIILGPLVARARAHRMFSMSCWKVSFHVDYHILRRKRCMKEGGLTPNQLQNKLAKAQKMRKLRVDKVWAQNIFLIFSLNWTTLRPKMWPFFVTDILS